ncbi:hypothetical protein ESCO_002811 [Escovopsis weberi]|uniref:DASH complex subunit SPC34 n=1 Tax=Escovopsis weberi TaxID=150374 RepID=A0A0N0RT01_ESCWE|nr:hypothetical protein ESCO_002811 [Escovopsis weberi]
MSLLDAHLEQIKISCQGIDALPFPPPRIFTNALLSNHDITALIRDTEAHERALFSVPPPPPPPSHLSSRPKPARHRPSDPSAGSEQTQQTQQQQTRRQTIFNVASGEVTTGRPTRAPRKHTAVAAVLGGEMHDQLLLRARGDVSASASRHQEDTRKGDVDVEVLLRGAEKLCTVYEPPGARERIAALRAKLRHGGNTMAYYEARVAEQAEQLASMNAGRMGRGGDEQEEEEEEEEEDEDEEDEEDGDEGGGGRRGEQELEDAAWTEEDLRREEEEARMMEVRKRELQMRLKSMQKDLGGLRDM